MAGQQVEPGESARMQQPRGAARHASAGDAGQVLLVDRTPGFYSIPLIKHK
jgi:hypothetical protein